MTLYAKIWLKLAPRGYVGVTETELTRYHTIERENTALRVILSELRASFKNLRRFYMMGGGKT